MPCTYSGPVFAHAGRRPSRSSSTFSQLGGGCALQAAETSKQARSRKIWITIDTKIAVLDLDQALGGKIVCDEGEECLTCTYGQLHGLLTAQIGCSSLTDLYVREPTESAEGKLRRVECGDSRPVPLKVLSHLDVLYKLRW